MNAELDLRTEGRLSSLEARVTSFESRLDETLLSLRDLNTQIANLVGVIGTIKWTMIVTAALVGVIAASLLGQPDLVKALIGLITKQL
jgi:hypothetical protein